MIFKRASRSTSNPTFTIGDDKFIIINEIQDNRACFSRRQLVDKNLIFGNWLFKNLPGQLSLSPLADKWWSEPSFRQISFLSKALVEGVACFLRGLVRSISWGGWHAFCGGLSSLYVNGNDIGSLSRQSQCLALVGFVQHVGLCGFPEAARCDGV